MEDKTKEQLSINYFNEAAYYISRQILLTMLVEGKITEEEYVKIDRKNCETYNPFLSRIMA